MKADEAKRVSDAVSTAVSRALAELVDAAHQNGRPAVVATSPDGKRLVKPDVPAEGHAHEPAPPGFRGIVQQLLHDEPFLQGIYNAIVDRMKVDPVTIRLLSEQPEIEITVQRRIVSLDGSSTTGRVARLIARGFFDEPRRQGACRAELARTGSDVNSGTLSTVFNTLVKDGMLTREGDSYLRAPGLKVTEKEIASL